nr:uncharacterized protein CTRU02_04943 [Colletotrichum truncatum]KAF6794742.1 integral membrane protein [Colletotrichum truncatum]
MASGTSLLWHPNSMGHYIYYLNIVLLIVSIILMLLRLYVRKTIIKKLGWVDLVAILAWAFCIAMSALEIDNTHYGTGAQIEDISPDTFSEFFKRLAILELVYFFASGAVRLYILTVISRLNKSRMYVWSIYALALIVVVTSLTGFFFVLTECMALPYSFSQLIKVYSDVFNYASKWRQCKTVHEEQSLFLAHAITYIFVDCMLIGFPLWAVTKYVRIGVEAAQLLPVFLLGIFAVVAGIVRFALISTTDYSVNGTYKMVPVSAWTDAELHAGFWVGCLPALQYLLRRGSYAKRLGKRPDSTFTAGKGSMAGSTDDSKMGSISGYRSSAFGNVQYEDVGAKSQVHAASGQNEHHSGQSRHFEMVDLEKGDEEHTYKQTSTAINVQVTLSETNRRLSRGEA